MLSRASVIFRSLCFKQCEVSFGKRYLKVGGVGVTNANEMLEGERRFNFAFVFLFFALAFCFWFEVTSMEGEHSSVLFDMIV